MSTSTVEIIQKWIQTEANFYGRTDENFIQNFLNICDDVEITKQKITRYYELRLKHPRIMADFEGLYRKDLKLMKQKALFCDIANENFNEPFLAVAFAPGIEADDTIYEALCTLMLVCEVALLHSPRFRKHGTIVVFDFKDFKMSHIFQFTPSFAINTLTCVLEGIPMKLQQVHIINVGYMLKGVITVAVSLLPRELSKKIWVHSGSWENLQNYIKVEELRLVQDCQQGKADEIFKTGYEIIMKYKDYILDDAKYGFKPIHDEAS
ncbi:hypothetical protein CHUAL_008564 [Chamberlinius hualienensis]